MSLETVAQEFLQYGNNQSGNGRNGAYSTKSLKLEANFVVKIQAIETIKKIHTIHSKCKKPVKLNLQP